MPQPSRPNNPLLIVCQAAGLIALGSAIGLAAMAMNPNVVVRADLGGQPVPPPPAPPSTHDPAGAATSGQAASPATDSTQGGGATAPPVATAATALPEGHISLADCKAWFDSGQAQFVDARTLDAYREGHIPGSASLPVADWHGGVPIAARFLDPGRQTVIYCDGGHECEAAEDVAIELKGLGFSKLCIFHDGYPGWKNAGYAIETGDPPQ